MNIGIKNVSTKDKLTLKIDFTSLETIYKFIDLLKFNNITVKGLGRDEYLMYFYIKKRAKYFN